VAKISLPPKIMIVDDEEDILEVIAMTLEECGYTVEQFSSPQTALQKFKERPEQYPIVLTDIRMPALDGVALSEKVLAIKPDVHILLMTAFDVDTQIFAKLPTIKKKDILVKPFSLETLCGAIKHQLAE
jgi:two-component system, cell cycle response regulator CpdR